MTILKLKKKKKNFKKADAKKHYFTKDTQDAILQFQKLTSVEEKHLLYHDKIETAFYALVDNLIRIHKYVALYKDSDELKHDCVSFLYETLGKFDGSRGTTAFSYFNVVAKNWLTVASRAKAMHAKRIISLEDDNSIFDDDNAIARQQYVPPADAIQYSPSLVSMLDALQSQRKTFSPHEEKCFIAILKICKNPDNIDQHKRTTIVHILKHLSSQGREFTVAINKLRKRYKKIRNANL